MSEPMPATPPPNTPAHEGNIPPVSGVSEDADASTTVSSTDAHGHQLPGTSEFTYPPPPSYPARHAYPPPPGPDEESSASPDGDLPAPPDNGDPPAPVHEQLPAPAPDPDPDTVVYGDESTAVYEDELLPLATLEARDITAWFGDHMVLDQVSLTMHAGEVTALIGPSGCGKSTFLRILNRMHQLVPGAALAGEVLLDGVDVYGTDQLPIHTRRQIGMVFQKPNPFPAMSISDNVLAGLRLSGMHVREPRRIVEESLTRAGLWKEVRNRLGAPGGSLSGGQQQRLCIARSLAVRPKVLLMDEPCSALDPASTGRIEETMAEIVNDVTVIIVTHNMQQARRVSDTCAFFMVEEGQPGTIVETGPTEKIFSKPVDTRTADYVQGRFG